MRRIRKYGEEILRKRSKEVENIDGNIEKIIKSMKGTLIQIKGVGLAAVQIGVLKRIFIAYDKERKNFITLINPKILEKKGEEIDLEGCLSFPEIYFSIKRAKDVIVEGYNEKGKKIIVEGKGIIARCFQHEIDHLDGILIIDYATEMEKQCYKEKIDSLLKGTKNDS